MHDDALRAAIIDELVKVDVAVATSRRHAALSCVRRFNKIQWTQVGLHRSEPRLSGTARPSSPICRSVRNAGLQSSVVVLAWIFVQCYEVKCSVLLLQ